MGRPVLAGSMVGPAGASVPWRIVTGPGYGATGGGVTEDTAAVQAAIDAAAPGDVVYFPKGTYLLGDLTIPQGSGVVLRGDSAGGSVLKLATSKPWNTTPWITTLTTGAPARNTDGLIIEHLTFDGNAAARSIPPRWLQTPAGAAITNPQNDYFANGGKINDPAHAANSTAVAASQSLAAAGNLTLTANPYAPNSVRKITITSAGNDSARTFTVTGTDYNNAALTATVTGANAGTATTAVVFKTVTQIAVNGATASTVTAGIAAFDIFGVVAEGRRNPGYTNTFPLLRLSLTENAVVRDCRFINHKGFGIVEAGGKNVTIERNEFSDVGKNDGPYMAIWTASHGTPNTGFAGYQDSEDIKVRDNYCHDTERMFCLFAPTKGGEISGNIIEDVKECGIFLSGNANLNGGKILIARNQIRRVRVSDIVARGIELAAVPDVVIRDNRIEDTDMMAVNPEGCRRVLIEGNHFRNCYATHTLPYGPFSERYGYNIGTPPIPGTTNAVADGSYISIGTLGTGNKHLAIRDNFFHEDRASYPAVFEQVKSGSSSIASDTVIEGNILDVPSAMTFLDKSVTLVWEANMPLSIRHNTGHASESPVVVTKQFAAGETGAYTVTCGFRPRLVRVYVAANNATIGQQSQGEFSWNRGVSNAFALRSASVSGAGQQVAIDATSQVAKLTDGAGVTTFLAGFTSWTEDGFIINPTTVTNITNVRFVCEP